MGKTIANRKLWKKQLQDLYGIKKKPRPLIQWVELDPFRTINLNFIEDVSRDEVVCLKGNKYQTIYVIYLIMNDLYSCDQPDVLGNMWCNYSAERKEPWFFMSRAMRDIKYDWLKKKLNKK